MMFDTRYRHPDRTHVKTVCMIGCGKRTCRYLVMMQNGFSCEKHTTLGRELDTKAKLGKMTARGDNCRGLDPRNKYDL